jgi:hypothetical protein
MRTILASALVLAAAVLFLGGSNAGEGKKEVTLKGTITCAKCDLKKETSCMTVIVTKKDDKETIYYFDAAASKKHHGKVCTEAHEGTVVGVVSKDGDKNTVTVKKVDFK